MSVLLDTNILTRLAEPGTGQAALAGSSVSLLIASGQVIHLVPQNLYEFWVVATRPVSDNGLGMTTTQARLKLDEIEASAVLLPDNLAVTHQWKDLVVRYDVKGKSGHDAKLVAAMSVHGIDQILTFNGQDFRRYQGITVLEPSTVVQQLGGRP